MARVSLSSLPRPHAVLSQTFSRLSGGLNLRELDYRLRDDESPDLENLWWQDGVLQSRDGQAELWASPNLGTGYACCGELFHGYGFAHIGTRLCILEPRADTENAVWAAGPFDFYVLLTGVPEVRGTFFSWGGWLFYKTAGDFIRIRYDASLADAVTPPFAAERVESFAYVPTLFVNGDWKSASGDLYEAENRLSPQKRLFYNAATEEKVRTYTGTGSRTVFSLVSTSAHNALSSVTSVEVDGVLQWEGTDYTVDMAQGTVTFTQAPADGSKVVLTYRTGVFGYYLPVKGAAVSVVSVKVDGAELISGTDYAFSKTLGRVLFTDAPPVTDPPENNTVEIVYTMANAAAYNAVMSCRFACPCGGENRVCIALGGGTGQANAFFWSGSGAQGPDCSYWPMTNYNLAGDHGEPITGLAMQYGELIVFQESRIGKASFSAQEIDGLSVPALSYTSVNDHLGCDLPWSIRLVENNLVFAHSRRGVYRLRDSSAAYENNLDHISPKVDGAGENALRVLPDRPASNPGLLYALQGADADAVCSADDGKRYWLCADGKVFCWDYTVSDWKDPAWFYFTGISAQAFYLAEGKLCHMDATGRTTVFQRTFTDYDQAFPKRYTFPTLSFGGYDRLKDVLACVFAVRSDTNSRTEIRYVTDYETRYDLTPIRAYHWQLVPRDLSFRFLGFSRFAHVERRRPRTRHVRHFSLTLENNRPGQDLSVVSAEVQYRFLQKDK